jgi:hypothetical protein
MYVLKSYQNIKTNDGTESFSSPLKFEVGMSVISSYHQHHHLLLTRPQASVLPSFPYTRIIFSTSGYSSILMMKAEYSRETSLTVNYKG